MSASTSDTDQLNSLANDFVRICSDLLKKLKQQKGNIQHQLFQTEQFMSSHTGNETEATLNFTEILKIVNDIKAEEVFQEPHITQINKQYKEAEKILANYEKIFREKQQLQSINHANERPVSSENLNAHQISASNAVCAPLTLQLGDAHRPYPTEEDEMHMRYLSRVCELLHDGHTIQREVERQIERLVRSDIVHFHDILGDACCMSTDSSSSSDSDEKLSE